jgi:hypothetical protein
MIEKQAIYVLFLTLPAIEVDFTIDPSKLTCEFTVGGHSIRLGRTSRITSPRLLLGYGNYRTFYGLFADGLFL